MYIFKIKSTSYNNKYNNKLCWVPRRNSIRDDGLIEVYVPETGEYILIRPKELEDEGYDG